MKVTAQSNRKAAKSLVILLGFLLVGIFTIACGQTFEKARQTTSENVQGSVKVVTIPVKGMSCSSCVSNVKKNVKSVEGVQQVAVSLENREATVTYASGKVSPEQLVKIINNLGYKAGNPVEVKKQ